MSMVITSYIPAENSARTVQTTLSILDRHQTFQTVRFQVGNNHYIPQQLAMWHRPAWSSCAGCTQYALAVAPAAGQHPGGAALAQQSPTGRGDGPTGVINQHGRTVMSLDGKSMHRVQP